MSALSKKSVVFFDHTETNQLDIITKMEIQKEFPAELRIRLPGDEDSLPRINSETSDLRQSIKRHRAGLWEDAERSWWRGDTEDCSRILRELAAWEARSLNVAATVELSVWAFLYGVLT